MALPKELGDREYQKFVETADGDVAVRQGPGGINDTDGNELALNSDGMAQVYDRQVMTQLKNMHEVLQDIRFHLRIITGVDE
jgi:hypothetical protein